jgi:hypothetical protein
MSNLEENRYSFDREIAIFSQTGPDYSQVISDVSKNSWKRNFNRMTILSFESKIQNEETLYLISIPNMKKSIIEGLNTSIEECETDLEW